MTKELPDHEEAGGVVPMLREIRDQMPDPQTPPEVPEQGPQEEGLPPKDDPDREGKGDA